MTCHIQSVIDRLGYYKYTAPIELIFLISEYQNYVVLYCLLFSIKVMNTMFIYRTIFSTKAQDMIILTLYKWPMIRSLCFMHLNWVITLQKQPKTFVVQKVKVQLITV